MDSSVVTTSTADHDLLIEVNANVKSLTASVQANTDSNNRMMNDHEVRLRGLESEAQKLKGAQDAQKKNMAIISTVGGLVGLALTIWEFVKP